MERLVLVHGSVTGGRPTWGAQRRGLGDRFELVVLERPGFPAGPPVDRGRLRRARRLASPSCSRRRATTSSGTPTAVSISLLAAARRRQAVRSLAVLEPRARVSRSATRRSAASREGGAELWANGPSDDPEAFLRASSAPSARTSTRPRRCRPSSSRARARSSSSAARGRRRSRSTRSRRRRSRSSSSRARTTRRSTRSATCSSATSPPSASSSPGYGHNPQLHPGFNAALHGLRRASSRTASPITARDSPDHRTLRTVSSSAGRSSTRTTSTTATIARPRKAMKRPPAASFVSLPPPAASAYAADARGLARAGARRRPRSLLEPLAEVERLLAGSREAGEGRRKAVDVEW